MQARMSSRNFGKKLEVKVPFATEDIVLAYGSHTPTLAVQDATFNLQASLLGVVPYMPSLGMLALPA